MSLTHNYFDREQDKPSGHSAPKHGQKMAPHRPSQTGRRNLTPSYRSRQMYLFPLSKVHRVLTQLIHYDYSISKSLSFEGEKANIRWFVGPLNKLTWPHFPSDLLTQNDKIQRICQSKLDFVQRAGGALIQNPFLRSPLWNSRSIQIFSNLPCKLRQLMLAPTWNLPHKTLI